MSERYSRVFTLNENLYIEGSPAMIKAGALLKDNETGALLAQLKLGSITDKVIKLVKVKVSCLDSVGRPLDEITHEYLDLHVTRDTDFGSKTAIKIANSATRSFSARITEIGFGDNEIWTAGEGEWESIPKQDSINTLIPEYYAISAYNAKFGASAKYSVKEYKDLWLCTCGAINHNEEQCYKCGASLAELKAIDIEALKEDGILAEKEQIYQKSSELYESGTKESVVKAIEGFEKIKDYKDSEEFIEKCNESLKLIEENEAKAMVAKKAKKKKSILVASIISCSAIILGLLSYFVAYPLISYSSDNYAPYIKLYNITEFEIPEGTTEIKSGAFSRCYNLTSVVIPDSVTSIGEYAFYYCFDLTSITIPDSVTSIGNNAFYGCDSLTSITIPDSVTSIGNNAFYGCENLASVTIPDSVTSIGNYSFSSCNNLASVTIPDSVITIGNSAFSWCENLASVEIGNGVTSIGEDAFFNCYSLTSITIPDSVTSIGKDAFKYCSSLTSATLPTFAISYIPKSNLKSVIITSGTSIGEDAFSFCSSLESITIPDSVTSIGEDAFYNCTSLDSITIPDSVTNIGDYAFRGCSSLTSVVIGDSVTSIGEYAFYNCDSLTSITIPNNVTSIGNYAFYISDKLTSIVYNGTVQEWKAITKGWSWYPAVVTSYVYCTDGTIKL